MKLPKLTPISLRPHKMLWKDSVDFIMWIVMLVIGIYLVIKGEEAAWGIIFYSVYVEWLIVRKNTWKYEPDQINTQN